MIWPPQSEPLEGTIVRLEPIAPSHREPLAAVSGEPDAWAWMDRRIPDERAAFDNWFDARLAASQAGEEWCLLTRRLGTAEGGGEVVGSSSYLAIRPPHDGLEIGWTWLHPSAWRSGANREAKLLMLRLAFETLGCMRVEFKTDARNERSRKALAGIGARFEGIFRQHMNIPGAGRRDSAYFSVTDDDWPAVRAALEAGIAAGGTPSHHLRTAEGASA